MINDEVYVYFAMRAGRPIVYLETQKKGKKLILLQTFFLIYVFYFLFLFVARPLAGLDQALHTKFFWYRKITLTAF